MVGKGDVECRYEKVEGLAGGMLVKWSFFRLAVGHERRGGEWYSSSL